MVITPVGGHKAALEILAVPVPKGVLKMICDEKQIDIDSGCVPSKRVKIQSGKGKIYHQIVDVFPNEKALSKELKGNSLGWAVLPLLEVEGSIPADTEEIRKETFLRLREVIVSGAVDKVHDYFPDLETVDGEATGDKGRDWDLEESFPKDRWPAYKAMTAGGANSEGKKTTPKLTVLRKVEGLKYSKIGAFSPARGMGGG